MTARVLADHFDTVTVLERDRVANGRTLHQSIPQGSHVHGLLLGGQQVMASLYPGFIEKLETLGADSQGFLAFAKSLHTRKLYDLIKDAERVTNITHYRFPTSVQRHYERLTTFPEGFLVLGDAISSFKREMRAMCAVGDE